jgi:hypothetical protein
MGHRSTFTEQHRHNDGNVIMPLVSLGHENSQTILKVVNFFDTHVSLF